MMPKIALFVAVVLLAITFLALGILLFNLAMRLEDVPRRLSASETVTATVHICGLMIGMAMASLAIALFAFGFRRGTDAAPTEKWYLPLLWISPGIFLVICASVIIVASIVAWPV